jgi:hypothetical protein
MLAGPRLAVGGLGRWARVVIGPLLLVQPAILLENGAEILAQLAERRLPLVMHEGVAGDQAAIAGQDRPSAKIVVLVVSDAEPLVEQPHAVKNLALGQEAKPDQAVGRLALAVAPLAKIPGESVERLGARVPNGDLLLAADLVGARSDQTHVLGLVERRQHPFEPTGGDQRVVVQQ